MVVAGAEGHLPWGDGGCLEVVWQRLGVLEKRAH
jgi:hypothetical protein